MTIFFVRIPFPRRISAQFSRYLQHEDSPNRNIRKELVIENFEKERQNIHITVPKRYVCVFCRSFSRHTLNNTNTDISIRAIFMLQMIMW